MKLDMNKYLNFTLERLEELYEERTINVSGDITKIVPATFKFERHKQYEDNKILAIVFFNRQKFELFETKEVIQERLKKWFAELPDVISA